MRSPLVTPWGPQTPPSNESGFRLSWLEWLLIEAAMVACVAWWA